MKQKKTRLDKLFSYHNPKEVKHRLISLDDKYLTNYLDEQKGETRLLIEAMQEQTVTLLRSGMGSGKTQLVRDFIKANPELTSLYISPRITLTGNAAMRLDSEFYLDYKHSITSKEQLQEIDHLAIVVNSLPMLIGINGTLRHFDILVLDEIEQLLRHLMSKIKDKKLVLECFYSLIRQAKYLIVGDAHLGNPTLDFLSELRQKERFLTILNHYQVGKGKEVLLYQASGNVQIAALVELLRGGKLYITFNCKKEARAFYDLVKEFYQHNSQAKPLSMLYISGDNNGEQQVKEFFANPNQEASKYDVIISTPSLSSGVSIDIKHFTFIGGIFTHTVNTPQDCQQALARVRNANTWHVFISDSKQSLPTEEEIIAAKWKHTHPFDQYWLMKNLGSESIYGFSDPIYENLCLNVERNRAFLSNDFFGNFIKELAIAGYEVKYKDNDEIKNFAATYFSKTGKVLEQKEYNNDVVCSKTLTKPEAKSITQKGSTTLEQKRALDKFLINEFYRLNPSNDQDEVNEKDLLYFVEKDQRGELRKKINRLEIAMSTDSQILRKYQEQELNGVSLIPDMKLYFTERHILSRLLEMLGINPKTLQYNGLIYSKETFRDNGFVNWIETNRKEFSGITYIPKQQDLEKDPLRLVSRLLKLIGLKQKRVGRASKGTYQIDTEQLSFIRQIVAKRSMASLVGGLTINDFGDDSAIE